MPLSLGVKRGNKIDIGTGHRLRVIDVPSSAEVVVRLDDGPPVKITDKEQVLLMPEVKVSVGLFPAEEKYDYYARLLFEAPRSINIQRVRRAKSPTPSGTPGTETPEPAMDGK